MKKRIIVLVVAAALALSAVATAMGGTQADPLISRSYLEGAYYESLRTSVAAGAKQKMEALYKDASQKLKQLAESYLPSLGAPSEGDPGAEEWRFTQQFSAQGGEKEDTVTLAVGSGILWTAGGASVSSGTLVDISTGAEVNAGGTLTANHRYLAAEQTVIMVTSRTAHWSLEGQWTSTSDGISVIELPFTDVSEKSWYYDAVCYVYEHSLFQGTSSTQFSPGKPMQRGMITTVLYRMAGSPAIEYTPMFNDIPAGIWYTNGTIWAGQLGIVSGVGNGLFRPNNNVQRQQIAVILYNYARTLGQDVSARGDLSQFHDADSVAPWAKDAVSWAVASGLLKGSSGKILPSNSATRAEVATMLQRFHVWLERI